MLKKILILSSLILTACGGGGGGNTDSTAPSSQSIRFTTLTPNQVSVDKPDGTAGLPVMVDVAFTGTTKLPIYVIVEDSENVFNSVGLSINEGFARLSLGINTSLSAGTYTTDVKLHACAGANTVQVGGQTMYQCVNEYPGSPVTLKRSVTIKNLSADKTALNFTATANTQPAEQIITVPTDRTVTRVYWDYIQNNQYNLLIDSQFGAPMIVGNQIKVRPNAIATPGTYSATMYLDAQGYYPQAVKVNYVVN